MLKNKQLKKQIVIAKKNLNLSSNFQILLNQKLVNSRVFLNKNKIININKFVTKYSTLFPINFTSYVKFPLQILSLNSQTKDFFKSVYYKFVIKIKHLFIKLNALNIMLYYKSSYIFILLSCFLNFVLFDLSLYYKCFFFSKTLN
jgi:hypothetical protein